ncbi:MAG: hypothetical protein FJ290_12950 [Planctomycetes bacterium]|nr:hypothetical protein [Planctomycetota bacterium]
MSDEPERAENAASEDTPATPPAEPETATGTAAATSEGKPPADELPAGQAAAEEAPTPVAEEPPSESAEEPAEEPEPPVEEKPPAPPAAPPPAHYDGLESGLAWFGFERFEPPAPVGYEAPPREAVRPPRELSVEERRRVHGRAAARRQEVESQKKWHQKIPMGALSMVPILVVLLVVAIIYPPWRTGGLPSSKEPLDEGLLTAQPPAEQAEALRQLGVAEALPSRSWVVLPGGVLAMPLAEPNAKVTFALPRGLAQAEISCDLCILDRVAGAWGATLTVDGGPEIALKAHPEEFGKDWVAARRADNKLGGPAHEVKLRMWDSVRLVVGAGGTSYYFNGSKLSAEGRPPRTLSKVELTTYNTGLLLRNWRVEPAK